MNCNNYNCENYQNYGNGNICTLKDAGIECDMKIIKNSNDLKENDEIIFFDDVRAVVTSWEWGLHKGKTYKRWYGTIEGNKFASCIINQPQTVEIA